MNTPQNMRRSLDTLLILGLVLASALLIFIQFGEPTGAPATILRLLLAAAVIFESILSFRSSPWKVNWMRTNAIGNAVVLLYMGYVLFILVNPQWYLQWGRQFPASGLIIIRNFLSYFRIIPRIRKVSSLLQSISLHPAQTLVLSFLVIILAGALLLMMPFSTVDGTGLGIIDAMFTATSAVCVTGLIVVDTPSHFTLAGQIIIFLLIQAGGLGIMLLSYTASWVINRQLDLKDKITLAYMTNEEDLSQVYRAMLRIVTLTVAIEAVGMLILALGFYLEGMGVGRSLWFGLFHSVSAFCNAGFALFTDSFEGFRDNLIINGALSALIILGGISFAVIINLGAVTAGRLRPRSRKSGVLKLSLNSRVVLSTTAILLAASTLLFYYSEHGNSLASLGLGQQYLASFFQAVTLRTAGFNTVNFAAVSSAAVWISIMFMIVGGASGSTAGGIKVNTLAVVFAYLRSRFRAQNRVLLFNFALTRNTASNALVLFVFAVFAVGGGFFLLLLSEQSAFDDLLFETVSAFATVGLSRGITGDLSGTGRVIIIVLMFMGRIGPLTLLTALSDRQAGSDVIYPEQEILIG